jgi:NAD(P)-dependent dehydrogenase (short-subunit alcohol dehydrogenase family)
MLLKGKVGVIYGAGGAIGSAVARAFASEGANLFLTGGHLAPVEAVAKDVLSTGVSAEAAEVNALDEQAVDQHLQSVIERQAASISRSTRSGSRMRRLWVCLWSTWRSSSSPCRSRPTQRRSS